MDSTITSKLKMEKVEFRNRMLKIRNRALKKRLEKCAEHREKCDLLVKKCEIHELHIDVLEKQCLENASLLRDAQNEIERLNAVVAHYEHQITSYSQRSATAVDVGERFEFETVMPQTPLNNSVSVSAPNATNEPDENLGFGLLNVEIKKELTDERDNASVWSREVAAENLKRFDQYFQPRNVESKNWKCEQDDRWSVFNGDGGRESGTEGEEERNGEDDDDTKYEVLSEESKTCRWWMRKDEKPCGHVSKDSCERMEHLTEEHLGLPGPNGYVCYWEDCRRNELPITTWKNMMVHLEAHSCQKQIRCTFKGCNKVFRYMSSLKWHYGKHRSKDPVKCTYPGCAKVFKSIQHVMQHLPAHNLFVCDAPGCGRIFKCLGPFKKHVGKHKAK